MYWNIVVCGELGIIIAGVGRIIYLLKKQKESSLQEKPKETQKENNNKECSRKLKDAFYKILSQYFLLGVIIILLGTIIFCLIPEMKVEENCVGVVLAFVGIAATFVVVSNVAQVHKVEKEFYEKSREIEGNFNGRVEGTQREFSEKVREIKDDFDRKIKEVDSKNDENEFKFNKVLGDISGVYVNMNFKAGLYLNAIHTYIEQIKYYSMIKRDSSFVNQAIESLILFLYKDGKNNIDKAIEDSGGKWKGYENTKWEEYSFYDKNNNEIEDVDITVMIEDIAKLNIGADNKQKILSKLSEIQSLKTKQSKERASPKQ
jgi:hypothetical protein